MHGWDALQVGDTREQTYSTVPVRCFGGPLFLLNNPWIDPTGYGRRLTSTTTHLSSSVDTLATCQWMYTQRDVSAACVRERGDSSQRGGRLFWELQCDRDGESRDDRGNFPFDRFWRTCRRPSLGSRESCGWPGPCARPLLLALGLK